MNYRRWLTGPVICAFLFFVLLPDAMPAKRYRGFFRSYDKAVSASVHDHQVMMLDFYRKGCFPSKQLDQEVYHNKEFLPFTDSMVCIKIDGETPSGKKIREKYNIPGYPTVLFVDPGGNELERITSYVPRAYFIETVQRILKGDAISALEKRFPQQTGYNDLYILSIYYVRNVFDKKKLDMYFNAFRELDPSYKKDSTRVLCRYVLQKELRLGVYSAAGEIESFLYDVPRGNSYKLAILLTNYFLKLGEKQQAWDFFSGYYMLRENKAPIEAYYRELKKKLGKE